MKTGIELIAEERQEQIEKHGRTIQQDVDYNYSENETGEAPLVMGAIAILKANDAEAPADWDLVTVQKMVDKTYKQRLVIAAALIAAEIDRLQALPNKENS